MSRLRVGAKERSVGDSQGVQPISFMLLLPSAWGYFFPDDVYLSNRKKTFKLHLLNVVQVLIYLFRFCQETRLNEELLGTSGIETWSRRGTCGLQTGGV